MGQQNRIVPRARAFLRRCCLLLPLLLLAAPALAASPPAAAPAAASPTAGEPAKIHELLGLLGDPQVQEWIKAQQAAKAAEPAAAGAQAKGPDLLATRFTAIRDHFAALAAVIPQLPAEFQRAGDALVAETHGHGLLVVLLAVFIGLGLGVAWLFLWVTRGLRRRSLELPMDTVPQRLIALIARLVYGVLLVAAFGLGSVGAFLIFDWPPLLREILLQYLIAFLAFCLTLVLSRFLLAPGAPGIEDVDKFRILPMDRAAARFWHRRLLVLAAWFAFGYATVMLLSELGFDFEARRLVAYILGLGLLAIGLEMVWRHPPTQAAAPPASLLKRRAVAWLLSILFLLLWLLWVASAVRLMWLLAVLVALPWAMRGAQRAVGHLLRPPGSAEAGAALPTVLTVALERGLRALLIIGGALLLAHVWNIDLVALTSSDTVVTRLLRGLLSTVVIVLVADFGWQLVKTAIDRKIVEAPTTTDQQSQEWRRQSRMKTLLPIFRNLLFIVLLVMVVMMALAALGVDIGPLVAGASVVGVAIGFGAQTLVRDIISGMFYLLDDAFRVGEYIQSGTYKGTVESFSLRSVKLRHHRGPLYTVPFGVLGAIQNMSRDWVIDKLSVGVTYDTDLNKVKKLIKQIGKELLEDPEFAPKIMETLKMQGVGQFGDFAIQIQMKLMTRPGEQFVIRRRAYAMIKKAFDANGVNFAYPTVQVAGGETSSAATIASVAQQALAKPAPAEG
jgi:moderate conductance mechanosensitive channel